MVTTPRRGVCTVVDPRAVLNLVERIAVVEKFQLMSAILPEVGINTNDPASVGLDKICLSKSRGLKNVTKVTNNSK